MTENTLLSGYRIEDRNSYVKISYRVCMADGRPLKGAVEPEVADFVTGYQQVIPGLERRLIGHETGERLSLVVPPQEAFGLRRTDLVFEKDKSDFHFPKGVQPYPGMEIPLVAGSPDAPDTVMIEAVKDNVIVINLNHPLAGVELHYDLEIIEARRSTETDVCPEWNRQGEAGECAASAATPSCSVD